jgi:hypothetical protein
MGRLVQSKQRTPSPVMGQLVPSKQRTPSPVMGRLVPSKQRTPSPVMGQLVPVRQPVYPISDEWFGGIPYEPVGAKYPAKYPVRTPSPVSPRKGLFPERSQRIQRRGGRGGKVAKKSPVGKFPPMLGDLSPIEKKTPSGTMPSPPPAYLSPNQYDLQHLITRYGRLRNLPGTSKKIRTPTQSVSQYVRQVTPIQEESDVSSDSGYESADSDIFSTPEEAEGSDLLRMNRRSQPQTISWGDSPAKRSRRKKVQRKKSKKSKSRR